MVAYNFGGAFLQAFWLFFKLFSFFKLFCPLTFPHFLLFFRMNLSILFSSSFHLLPLSLPPSFLPSLPSPFFPPLLASTLPLSSPSRFHFSPPLSCSSVGEFGENCCAILEAIIHWNYHSISRGKESLFGKLQHMDNSEQDMDTYYYHKS